MRCTFKANDVQRACAKPFPSQLSVILLEEVEEEVEVAQLEEKLLEIKGDFFLFSLDLLALFQLQENILYTIQQDLR